MALLCEMPNGPHVATKEEYVPRLGDYCGVGWRSADWNRYDRLYEDAIRFIIEHTKPMEHARNRRDHEHRYRLCPWCLQQTPSCLSRCATCFTDLFSIGKFHRTVRQEDAPLEVPAKWINRSIEEAEIGCVTIPWKKMTGKLLLSLNQIWGQKQLILPKMFRNCARRS